MGPVKKVLVLEDLFWRLGQCHPIRDESFHEGLRCAQEGAPVEGHQHHSIIETLVHPTTNTIDEGFAALRFPITLIEAGEDPCVQVGHLIRHQLVTRDRFFSGSTDMQHWAF